MTIIAKFSAPQKNFGHVENVMIVCWKFFPLVFQYFIYYTFLFRVKAQVILSLVS